MGKITGLDLEYNYIISNPANYGRTRSTSDIKYIVIHYTANNGDTDTGNGNYFANNKVGASAHYFVDENSCTQSVPDNKVAYHCETKGMTLKGNCRNSNSIGVEMCSDKVNGQYVITKKTKENTVIITKWLMQKYNIPVDNVIRHYDVCGKGCPEPWVRVSSEWEDFKGLLVENIKEDNEMVSETYISVNGKDIKINRILKDGKNYIDLRGLENTGFSVGYNSDTKLPTLNNSIKKLPVVANGSETTVDSVNIKGLNYCSLRDVAAAVGSFDVDFINNKVILNSK